MAAGDEGGGGVAAAIFLSLFLSASSAPPSERLLDFLLSFFQLSSWISLSWSLSSSGSVRAGAVVLRASSSASDSASV